jgi:SAM-dependent methyltransferase
MSFPKWLIKAVVQKTISFLPASRSINYFFQKHVTRGVRLNDEHFRLKYQHAHKHFRNLKTLGGDRVPGRILELGTGWYPVVPMLFYLTGCDEVLTVDIHPWMTVKTQMATISKYREWRERGWLDELLPSIREDRWEALMNVLDHPPGEGLTGINALIGLSPLIRDARNLDLEDDSLDFICSNNTFEHIPEEILVDILREFSRLLGPGGVMSHFIDMSDHFAHFDPGISIYNFLKFSKRTWRMLDNRIQPQNRLRYRDYVKMYAEAGLPVTHETLWKGEPERLDAIRIHPEFSAYSREELAVSHACILSCMPQRGEN